MKTALLILLTILSFIIRGQNYIISSLDTVKYGNPTDFLVTAVTFSNTSTNIIPMFYKRIYKSLPPGWTSCNCTVCIAPTGPDSLEFSIPIATKFSQINFERVITNFWTNDVSGVGEVVLVFNQVGVNHFDTIRFRGITTSVAGIKTIEKETFIISSNPALDFISIKNIDMEAKTILLYDSIGREIYKNSCEQPQPEYKIDVSKFSLGLYYLSVQFTDNSSYRKKIIIE